MKFSRLVVSLAVLAGPCARADVLYDQMTNHDQTSFQSSWRPPEGFDSDQYVYDNFLMPTSSAIQEVWFVGTSMQASFTIRFYTAWAAAPDAAISSTALAPDETSADYIVSHTFTSTSSNQTLIPGTSLYQHHVVLPTPLYLTGNTVYWIRIVGDAYFALAKATHGRDGRHRTYLTGWNGAGYYNGDVAFQLRGTPAVVQTFTISGTASPANGGTVTGAGTYDVGNFVTLTATPSGSRVFLNWTESGSLVSTSAAYSFLADKNRTLKANFVNPTGGPYVITATVNPVGAGSVGGGGTFSAGNTVSLDASAQDGVQFLSWTDDGVVVSTSPTYNFTANAHRNLQANIANPAQGHYVYALRSPANTGSVIGFGGQGWSTGSDTYNRGWFFNGTVVTLVPYPPAGYHIARWLRDGMVVGTGPQFKHVVVEDKAVTAVFKPNNPVLTLNVEPAAAGSVSGDGTYASGDVLTASAVAHVGYEFASWTLGGTIVSTNPGYTQTLMDHQTLTANFAVSKHLIDTTTSPSSSGTVSGGGFIGHGAAVSLTATPAAGYYFDGWMQDGVAAGSTNPFSFTADANHAVTASFALLPVLNPKPPAAGGGFGFSWPSSFIGWTLEESPDLSPGSWVPSSETITTNAGEHQISIPAPANNRFFRLARP